MRCPIPLFPRLPALTLAALTGGLDLVPFLRHRRIPEKPTKATPVHPPPAISTLNGPPTRPSQAPSASSSRQNFVVVRNKGLKSKIPVSAGFLAVQGRLLSGKFPRKRPEIRLFHRADASQGCALACIQRAGRTETVEARTVGSKVASLGVDLPVGHVLDGPYGGAKKKLV